MLKRKAAAETAPRTQAFAAVAAAASTNAAASAAAESASNWTRLKIGCDLNILMKEDLPAQELIDLCAAMKRKTRRTDENGYASQTQPTTCDRVVVGDRVVVVPTGRPSLFRTRATKTSKKMRTRSFRLTAGRSPSHWTPRSLGWKTSGT